MKTVVYTNATNEEIGELEGRLAECRDTDDVLCSQFRELVAKALARLSATETMLRHPGHNAEAFFPLVVPDDYGPRADAEFRMAVKS